MLDSQSLDEKVTRSKGDEQASPSTARSLAATTCCQRAVTDPLPAPRPEIEEAESLDSRQPRRSLTSEGHHAGDGPEITQDISQAQEVSERSAYQSTTDTSPDTEQGQASLKSKTGLQQTKETDAPPLNKPRISLPTGKRSALNGTSYEPFIVDSEDLPTLEQHQLGEHMPETLHKLSQTSGYRNKAKLPWLTDISPSRIKKALTPEGDPDVQFNGFRLRADGGVNVYRDDPEDGRKFEWPDFNRRVRPMTATEASQELDRFLTKPDPYVSYYCGLMKSELWKLCPLHAGEQLTGIKGLTHVNQIYTHLGKKGSATAMHKEDDRFGSVNVGLAGTKLFLLIETEDTKRFETWVRSNYTCKPCPQFVRHLNIFFGQKKLEAAQIRFKILLQRVGDLIETKPHQYHQVVNLEDSLAISINLLAPKEIPKFLDMDDPLEVCDECGLKGLYGRKNLYVRWVDPDVPAPGSHDDTANARGRKRKAHGELLEVTRDCTKHFVHAAHASKSSIGFSEVCQLIREGAPGFEIPQGIGPHDLNILKMVAWIVSPSAIQQFTSLVRAWRTRQTYRVISGNAEDPLKEYATYLREAVGKTEISRFQLRYVRACIAEEVDVGMSQRLRLKLNKKEGEAFAQQLGMTSKDLRTHLEDGRAWNRIRGRFDGLLPFIYLSANDPFNISVKDWKAMGRESLKLLHYLLDVLGEQVEQRCRAGRIVQDIILRGSSAVFVWEENSRPLGVDDIPILGKVVEPPQLT
ncbi:histone demethylation 3d [Fusarium denticulatum]|uniref:Histone demethylation 3d n=1 Tax=Fusarium denticulatum TaxID=48507 RepID=A0A8H5WM78_9HYPO|nr:histone demethylation 3d [Fusarium denticulatum]